MDAEKLKEILRKHEDWIDGKAGGEKADFCGEDLREADFRGAELSGVSFLSANLRRADFRGANLRWADFRWADFRWADFSGAKVFEGWELIKVEEK